MERKDKIMLSGKLSYRFSMTRRVVAGDRGTDQLGVQDRPRHCHSATGVSKGKTVSGSCTQAWGIMIGDGRFTAILKPRFAGLRQQRIYDPLPHHFINKKSLLGAGNFASSRHLDSSKEKVNLISSQAHINIDWLPAVSIIGFVNDRMELTWR